MTAITKVLRFEEGLENEVYYDIYQYPTIGIGKKIGIRNAPLNVFNLTMPDEVAEFWLNHDLSKLREVIATDEDTRNAWEVCNEPRKDMLVAMAYQMGFNGLCGFRNMLEAMEEEEWQEAYEEALDSKWAKKDTPDRANREAEVILLGNYTPYDEFLSIE